MSHAEATQMIVAGRSSHFDPDIVDAFVAIQDEFLAISQRYIDSDSDIEEKICQIDQVMAHR